MSKDLSIAGPGSPVSLQKVLESDVYDPSKEIICLVDNSGAGIVKDADNTVYITVNNCEEQALYFQSIFNGKQIPAYLYRYLAYMFFDKEYNSDKEMLEELEIQATKEHLELKNESGKIEELDEYKQILNKIKYCNVSAENCQIIGLIQLIAGSLSAAKKEKKGIRIYLEHPETHLHPSRQLKLIKLINKLKKDYE